MEVVQPAEASWVFAFEMNSNTLPYHSRQLFSTQYYSLLDI